MILVCTRGKGFNRIIVVKYKIKTERKNLPLHFPLCVTYRGRCDRQEADLNRQRFKYVLLLLPQTGAYRLEHLKLHAKRTDDFASFIR